MKRKKVREASCFCLLFLAGVLPVPAVQATEMDWTEVNPAFAGATYVSDESVCAVCHEDAVAMYEQTPHGRAFRYGPEGSQARGSCESCHGPRSKHIDDPEEDDLTFSVAEHSVTCQQCHTDGRRMHWQSGLHNAAGVGCVSCHSVMENRSATALLSKASQVEVCASCHAGVQAKMSRASHHPVKEGRLECSSCHNPHGAPGRGMLVKATVNETCTSCHAERRGPFLWEHAPVRENCLTCHEPHGSNNKNLLLTQSASQCVTCHQYGGHVNQYRYNRVSTPYGNGCVNCHTAVHGSNHPSGAKFTR